MLADRILFADADALLVDKPAGLAVDRPRDGSASVAAALDGLRLGFRRPPTIVHRLDRDTSGCLLLARSDRAHRVLAAAFEAGAAAKTYLAVLDGVPAGEGGVIDLPLAKRSTREAGWRMVPDPGGKAAVTDWRRLGEAGGRALVRLRPRTGRTHQLRVHAAAGLGFAIAGDPVYGDGERDGSAMRLHAWRLAVPRPGRASVTGEAPPPAGFDPWRHLLGGVDDAG